MLDHVALQAQDVNAATAFYLQVFAPLGIQEVMRRQTDHGPVVGMAGPDGFPHFWLGPTLDGAVRETHVAFTAPNRSAVDQVAAAALLAGAEVLHSPRLWPEYHPNYYGVFVRDLDGNNVEAVCHAG